MKGLGGRVTLLLSPSGGRKQRAGGLIHAGPKRVSWDFGPRESAVCVHIGSARFLFIFLFFYEPLSRLLTFHSAGHETGSRSPKEKSNGSLKTWTQ